MMKKMKGRKFGRKGDTAAMLDHFDKTIVINFFFFLCILFFYFKIKDTTQPTK